jgi:hypothetical protein
MVNLRFRACFQIVALPLILFCSGLSADWRPYHARYEVYRNGKLTGELEITYEQDGNHWNISSEGTGTRGLAHFLRAKENEYAEGTFEQGRFRPVSYTYYKRVAGNDDLWTAGFDWRQGTVDITRGRKVLTLDTTPETVDALSLKLELRRRLRDRDPDLVFMQVDDDKIKEMVYRVLESEEIETPLGCLQATPVERIHLGGTRFSRSWHAPQLDFIMVRLEHGKSNGDDIEMHIVELKLDQQNVKPVSGCAAPRVSG